LSQTFKQHIRAKLKLLAAKPTLSLISKWTGDKGEHTSKIKLIRNNGFVQLWVNNSEKHCGIRLDAAMQQQIVEFLKIKD
jgi:hypothetical protein